MNKILITGSSGFIGSELLNIIPNHDLDQFIFWNRDTDGDLLNQQTFKRFIVNNNIQTVCHLAWCNTGSLNYDEDSLNYTWGEVTFSLVQLCLNFGINVLVLGSGNDKILLENHSTPYHKSKFMLRQKLYPMIKSDVITWLSPQYVYSLSKLRPRLVSYISHSILQRRPIILESPDDYHDFIDVRDAARGILEVIKNGMKGEIYIGSGTIQTVRLFSKKVIHEYESKFSHGSCILEDVVNPNFVLDSSYKSSMPSKSFHTLSNLHS